jgi:Zn-dependent protease
LTPEHLALLPLWYVVFLLSITCHEAAHAWAAQRGGDLTAYHEGQVSLNPAPHVRREPLGTVLVPLASYFLFVSGSGQRWMIGWASAPYDPYWEARHPKRAAWMAAAGPAANLLLAGLAFATLKLGLALGTWGAPLGVSYDRLVATSGEAGLLEGLGRMTSVLFSLNLILFLFNLIPFPPMDGATVLGGWFAPFRDWRERTGANPFFSMIGLLLAWQVFPHLFAPVYLWCLSRLYG